MEKQVDVGLCACGDKADAKPNAHRFVKIIGEGASEVMDLIPGARFICGAMGGGVPPYVVCRVPVASSSAEPSSATRAPEELHSQLPERLDRELDHDDINAIWALAERLIIEQSEEPARAVQLATTARRQLYK